MSVLHQNRILIVVPVYGSYRVFLSGLAEWLVSRGWDVHVACTLDADGPPDQSVGVTFHSLAVPRNGALLELWGARKALQRLILEVQPIVVHAHFSVAVLCLALCAPVIGCRYIATFQGLRFPLATGLKRFLFMAAECFSIRRMSHSWVLTKDDYEAVPTLIRAKLSIQDGYGFGCDLARYTPVGNSRRKTARDSLGISRDAFVFVFMGRLTRFKGFPIVLDAFEKVHARNPDVRLLVIGEEDPQHPLMVEGYAAQRGVMVLGWQEDPQLYLSAANTMVFPSEREGMPVCVMEAIASGLPVVGCDTRGVRELIQHEVTGLIAVRNVDAVAKAMERIARDSDLYAKLTEGVVAFRELLGRSHFYHAVEHALKEVDE